MQSSVAALPPGGRACAACLRCVHVAPQPRHDPMPYGRRLLAVRCSAIVPERRLRRHRHSLLSRHTASEQRLPQRVHGEQPVVFRRLRAPRRLRRGRRAAARSSPRCERRGHHGKRRRQRGERRRQRGKRRRQRGALDAKPTELLGLAFRAWRKRNRVRHRVEQLPDSPRSRGAHLVEGRSCRRHSCERHATSPRRRLLDDELVHGSRRRVRSERVFVRAA